MHSSQIQLPSEEQDPRTQSAVSGPRQYRTNHAMSTHSVLPPKKIIPKHASLAKKAEARRSESTHLNKNNDRSLFRYKKLDLTAGEGGLSILGGNPLKEYKRQTLRGKVRATLNLKEGGLKMFLDKVEEFESEFVASCHEIEFCKAADVIVRLLNYAVDFNLPQQLLRALKMLADLYFLTDNLSQAFFFYNQTREGCLLLSHPVLLVQSLLGLAECCGKCGIQMEGICILKKALEYTWIYNLNELELRIYDEIGKLHYHMGQLTKARQYHARHINALYEPSSSALKFLSAQRILKAEQLNLEIKYKEVSLLLLVHLKVPIKNISELQLPFTPPEGHDPVRRHFNINSKYFKGEEVPVAAKHLLANSWFFREEIEDPSLPDHHHDSMKTKKFAFLDFQLNKHLRRLDGGMNRQKQKVSMRSQFPVKESLEEQVARKMKEPPLQTDWYEKIIKQISRDHRNKLLNVRDAVRVRGFNRKVIPPVEAVRDLYNGFFDRWKHFGGRQSQGEKGR